MNLYPIRCSEPETYCAIIVLAGAGASTPTKSAGQGVTVSRSGAGVLSLAWSENPGTFLGAQFGWGAATAADVDGWTASHGTFSANALPLAVFSDALAAADLPADTTLTIFAWFKTTAV